MLAFCYNFICTRIYVQRTHTHAHTYTRGVFCTVKLLMSRHHFEVEKKNIVFITISNRNESHSLHCINPKSGFPMILFSVYCTNCMIYILYIVYGLFPRTVLASFTTHLFCVPLFINRFCCWCCCCSWCWCFYVFFPFCLFRSCFSLFRCFP